MNDGYLVRRQGSASTLYQLGLTDFAWHTYTTCSFLTVQLRAIKHSLLSYVKILFFKKYIFQESTMGNLRETVESFERQVDCCSI